MPEQAIHSDDMALKTFFQDFYRVPDYQREYVWGEADPKGQRGDEVEQFLRDIQSEFENANAQNAPEYFIGTIVVCPGSDGVFDLIDGQQRVTTAFLTLCAIRDLLKENGIDAPAILPTQIFANSVDWQGRTVDRVRLDLQYDDSRGVLDRYAKGNGANAPTAGTRSIANISGAYLAIVEFLKTQFKQDPDGIKRFYGYFTNKVKLIRIQTESVAKALKIFETINDRGVGLDAMDLLKNLLFMSAQAGDFAKLKETWKQITDAIYQAKEKPLRFLRYFVFADYDVADAKLQEDAIYDWFLKNEKQTGHAHNPIAFVDRLLRAAQIYGRFVAGKGPDGRHEEGINNTRYLGGSAVRQHYILLLAGRNLKKEDFARLANELENLMFVYLISNYSTRDYERSIIDAARKLRIVADAEFDKFCDDFFVSAKKGRSRDFDNVFTKLRNGDTRAFRMRYLLAKLTQAIDVRAYGSTGHHGTLANYVDGKNDIEHILPENASVEALAEFRETSIEPELVQRLGNLLLLESSINRVLGNKPYSQKIAIYPQSQYLLVKCQASKPLFGVADRITKAISTVPSFDRWTRKDIDDRQVYLARLAREVWGVPSDASAAITG
jgi:uncharacterized protein with ParB-like and HNH nuclease domain